MPGVSAVRSTADAYLLKSMRDICDDMCADGTAGSLCTCDTQPPARAKTLSPDEERRLNDMSDFKLLQARGDICTDLCSTGEGGSLCICGTQPPAKSQTTTPARRGGSSPMMSDFG